VGFSVIKLAVLWNDCPVRSIYIDGKSYHTKLFQFISLSNKKSVSPLISQGKRFVIIFKEPNKDSTVSLCKCQALKKHVFFLSRFPALLQKAGASRMMINLPQLINFVH